MARKKPQPKLQPKTAVIYARYSSQKQNEESIEQQIAECMSFAERNNLKIVEIYSDKATSGRTDHRPAFKRMMNDAECGRFNTVIAYKSNRIARNMLNALSYESKLDELGINTLYAKEEFGNTAAGRFALRTMMNVNQFYSENLSEDIMRGMMDNAENCKVNGVCAYGYMRGPDGKYVKNEREAAIVKEIFARYLSGESQISIATDLNARRIKTRAGKEWGKNSFQRILSNTTYIGIYQYNGIVKEGGVPAIVDADTFDEVQKRRQNPTGRWRRSDKDFFLTGKLFCGHCGGAMVGTHGTSKTGAKHYYYACGCKLRHDNDCKKKNVRKDEIENLVAKLTMEIVLQDEMIEWIADCTMEAQAEAEHTPEIIAWEEELAEQKKQRDNLMNAILQGIITPTTKEKMFAVEEEITALERCLAIAKTPVEKVSRERVVWSLRKLRDECGKSKEILKELIATFIKAIYLYDDEIRIDYNNQHSGNSVTARLYAETQSSTQGVKDALTKRGIEFPSPPSGVTKKGVANHRFATPFYLKYSVFVLSCPP